MKRLILLISLVSIVLTGCATQSNTHCGTKQQKKAKHNSMKRGTSPGGGMLN